MDRTRHSIEAQLMTRAARRRASVHRDPSVIEIVFGLSAFVVIIALGLYLATAFAG